MKALTLRLFIFVAGFLVLALLVSLIVSLNRGVNDFYFTNPIIITITRSIGIVSVIGCFVLFFLIKKASGELSQSDIKRRQAEGELAAMREITESAKLTKRNFLSNISHEMRTPLNGILGFADILSNTQLSKKEQEEYLEHIKTSGSILLKLISDMLEFNKIETGKIEIKNESFH